VIVVATMPCGGWSGRDGLLRCESCTSPLRTSSSESELSVSCAKSQLFGIGRRGLHEAVAARSCCDFSSVKSESLDHGGVMTMMSAGNLDDNARFQECVWFTFGSQGGCVCPHGGRVP
jgi:hypothetical protein